MEGNITAFGSRHFRRDNRPVVDKSAAEKRQIAMTKMKEDANLDLFYNKRAKQTANIKAPSRITAYRSTETRLLLGAAIVDEINCVSKEKPMPKPVDDDSDSGLEFEDDKQMVGKPSTFKDFLAQKKISYEDRFGSKTAGAPARGMATDLGKRRKTAQD